jgi:hypothetical protein
MLNPENWYWAELRSATAAGNWPRAWQLVAAWPSHPPSPRPPTPTHLNPPAHRQANLTEAASRAQDYLMTEACRADLVSEALRWFWVLEHYLCQPVYALQGDPRVYDDAREGTTIHCWPQEVPTTRLGPLLTVWGEFGNPGAHGITFHRGTSTNKAGVRINYRGLPHEDDLFRFPAFSVVGRHKYAHNLRTGLKVANGMVRAGEVMRNTLLLLERLKGGESGAVRCDLLWCSDIRQKLLEEGWEWHPHLTFRPDPDGDDEENGLLPVLEARLTYLIQELGEAWWEDDDAGFSPEEEPEEEDPR